VPSAEVKKEKKFGRIELKRKIRKKILIEGKSSKAQLENFIDFVPAFRLRKSVKQKGSESRRKIAVNYPFSFRAIPFTIRDVNLLSIWD